MKLRLYSSIFIVASLVALLPQFARAHATPLEYIPQAGAVISQLPPAMTIRFSERIEEKASLVRIFSSEGGELTTQSAKVTASDPRVYSVELPPTSEDGVYTVSWQVVSADDGHFTKGAFSFSVGEEIIAVPTQEVLGSMVTIDYSSPVIEGLSIWLELLGQALLIGCVVLFSYVSRASSGKLIAVGVFLNLIGAAGYLFLKTRELQAFHGEDFLDSGARFIKTVAGFFTAARVVLVLIFWALYKKMPARRALLLGVLFLIVLARARVSHAAASHLWPHFSVLINAMHLFAKELWIGGVIVLAILSTHFSLPDRERFSRLIWIAFGVAGVTGAYIIWLHLKDPAFLLTTLWGQRCIALGLCASVLLLLRLCKSSLFLEACAGVAVLLVTGFIIITTPPMSSELAFRYTHQSNDAQITFSPHAYREKTLLLEVDVPITRLIVTAENPEKSIGPLVVETKKIYEGGYIFPESLLSPPGRWRIEVTAQRSNAFDAVAQFEVSYPFEEIAATPRTFDLFALLSLLGALGCGLLAVLLYRGSMVVHMKIIAGVTAVGLLGLLIYNVFFVDSFQKLCEKNGDVWYQMSCMVGEGSGMMHFGDRREYEYFMRPVGELQAALRLTPSSPRVAEPVRVELEVTDAQGESLADDIVLSHDRRVHAVIVGEDLKTFAHIHPPEEFTFPHAGRYLIAMDFQVRSDHIARQFFLDVGGGDAMAPFNPEFARKKNFDDYAVALEVSSSEPRAGVPVSLHYAIEKNAAPVTDLVPYLAAPMHLAVVRSDLQSFIHTHGELAPPDLHGGHGTHHVHEALPAKFGPDIYATIVFPTPGLYQIFAEFKHGEKVIPTAFMIEVK